MRLVVAVAGLLFAAVPASAQYYGPRPAVPIGPPSAYDVAEIVQAMGLDPIGPPGRSGPFFVQRATGRFRPGAECDGRCAALAGDRRRGGSGRANAPYGRYAGYGPYRRPHPGYAPLPPDDEVDFAAPGSIMGARVPPHAAAPTPRSAAVTPHPATPPQAVAPKPAAKSATRDAGAAQAPGRRAAGGRRIGRAGAGTERAPPPAARACAAAARDAAGHAARMSARTKRAPRASGRSHLRSAIERLS